MSTCVDCAAVVVKPRSVRCKSCAAKERNRVARGLAPMRETCVPRKSVRAPSNAGVCTPRTQMERTHGASSRFFPLLKMTEAERDRWEALHIGGLSRVQAMREIGREDLIGVAEINDA